MKDPERDQDWQHEQKTAKDPAFDVLRDRLDPWQWRVSFAFRCGGWLGVHRDFTSFHLEIALNDVDSQFHFRQKELRSLKVLYSYRQRPINTLPPPAEKAFPL